KKETSGELRAPSEPGLYEVRYVLNEGKRVLASAPVEVTEAEVTVTAPESVVAGSAFGVSWSRVIGRSDMVGIVPVGAEPEERGNYRRVKDETSGDLRAPSEPGLYEVRYVLNEGKRVLASASVEVTEPEVTVSAPDKVRAGDPVEVVVEGDQPSGRDRVSLVPAGAGAKERGEYARAKGRREIVLTAPETPGLYEVRYVLDEGARVLGKASLEVVPETATLNTGGALEAPESAAPGETVNVSWSAEAEGGRLRVSLARADQADFTWIEAKTADNEPPLRFEMPEAPGFYEFRLLDLSGPKVLSRAVIELR
ncbi:MAG: hypothetical protein ACQEUZ_05180, partial [Pseudomonadota bacterium]